MRVPEAAGLCGAGLIGLCYVLNLAGVLDARGWRYPATNLLGSALILWSFTVAFNLPSLLIELFWSGVSLVGVAGAVRRMRA